MKILLTTEDNRQIWLAGDPLALPVIQHGEATVDRSTEAHSVQSFQTGAGWAQAAQFDHDNLAERFTFSTLRTWLLVVDGVTREAQAENFENGVAAMHPRQGEVAKFVQRGDGLYDRWRAPGAVISLDPYAAQGVTLKLTYHITGTFTLDRFPVALSGAAGDRVKDNASQLLLDSNGNHLTN